MNDFWELFSPLIVGIAALIGVTVALCWYASARQAKLLNQQFGTAYTTADMFWTGETVQQILEGQRLRIDLREP